MIITSFEEIGSQANLSDNMRVALNFLSSVDPLELAEGRIDIDGDKVFGFSQRYETKPATDVLYEAHRDYVDIQCMIAGSEMMGWTPVDQLTITQEYKKEGDCLLGSPSASYAQVPFHAGQVMILQPSDAHGPGIAFDSTPKEVRKIVLKVALA